MTTHHCPDHGEYTRMELLPPKIRAVCPACSARYAAAFAIAQAETDQAYQLWQRWQHAELPARHANRTVDNWRPRAGQQAAAAMVAAWIEGMAHHVARGVGLILMGAPGVGKTHLLAGLVTAAVQNGYCARYASWPDVWDRCKPPYDGHRDTVLRDLASVPVLALDEIALRPASDKEQAKLFELIDARYRQELPTLIATNATEATLSEIGERTVDRLHEACIPIVIPGSSNRAQAALDHALQDAAPPVVRPQLQSVTLAVTADSMPGQRTQLTRWPP